MDEEKRFKLRNIQAIFDVANVRILTMKKGMKNAYARLERLHKAGFHLEALMVNAQLVEHAIKNVLFMCHLKKDVCMQLNLPNPYPIIQVSDKQLAAFTKDLEDFNEKSLGGLIGMFRLISDEKEVADELNKFNDKRVETIHHAFNGVKDLEDFDAEAHKTVEDMSYKKAIILLGLLHQKIQDEITQLCEDFKNSALGEN